MFWLILLILGWVGQIYLDDTIVLYDNFGLGRVGFELPWLSLSLSFNCLHCLSYMHNILQSLFDVVFLWLKVLSLLELIGNFLLKSIIRFSESLNLCLKLFGVILLFLIWLL